MTYFTWLPGRKVCAAFFLFALSLCPCLAQGGTNPVTPIPDPTALETPGSTAAAGRVHTPPRALPVYPVPELAAPPVQPFRPTTPPAPGPMTQAPAAPSPAAPKVVSESRAVDPAAILTSLMILAALGGFLLYQCGLIRAKNCGHTSMLLLVGASFGMLGYWMGGFAVQTGGVGDAHAALNQPVALAEQGALDHELGLMAGGHHWGLMGSAGFFLTTDDATRDDIAALFLAQAVLVAFAVAASLGGALERGRLLALAVMAFLTGAVIYPLIANWIWGGGWLAEVGREFSLGHGVIDLAGAGVVHEVAGVLALVIALRLGPRHGRFQRNKATGIPGHNVPFTVLGALILLLGIAATNSAGASLPDLSRGPAVTNVLLGAIGGLLATVLLGAGKAQQATPARLTRALLGGAVSICAGSALLDPWAAFLIGATAGLLVEGAARWLVARGIDDPVNAAAIHGAGGAWGLLAIGFFANGTGGRGLNGIAPPIRGLFFGGRWHQLAAQAIGCAVIFLVVFVLGFLSLLVVQKILGLRVKLADELQGLDWPQVGALGYQPDVDSSNEPPQAD